MAPPRTNAVVWQAALLPVPTEGSGGSVTCVCSASGVSRVSGTLVAEVRLAGLGMGVVSVKSAVGVGGQPLATMLAGTGSCSVYGTVKNTPELKPEKSGRTAVRMVATLTLPPASAPSCDEMAENGTPPPRPQAERWPHAKTLLVQSACVGSVSLFRQLVVTVLGAGGQAAATRGAEAVVGALEVGGAEAELDALGQRDDVAAADVDGDVMAGAEQRGDRDV